LLRGTKRAVSYLLKYLHFQDKFLRYHWSWNWVFKGFARHWSYVLRSFKNKDGLVEDFKKCILFWNRYVYEKCLNVRLPQSTLT
jgi:hypothetical protein